MAHIQRLQFDAVANVEREMPNLITGDVQVRERLQVRVILGEFRDLVPA